MHVFTMPKKIIEGFGSIQHIEEFTKALNISNLLVVCSPRITNEMKAITNTLEASFYTGVKGEPTTAELNHLVETIQNSPVDGLLAVGGGSILDITKAAALLAKNKDTAIDSIDPEQRYETYPLIAVPTTAGTGSEVTKISVITDAYSKIKYNPSHFDLMPDVAILDANFLQSLPAPLIAQTGIDALAHAMEAYVSTKATKLTDHYALKAIKLIGINLPLTIRERKNKQAASQQLFASNLAGLAFSNASTNLAHATGRAMGSKLDLPHGLSVALTLIPTLEFGLDFARKEYAQIAKTLGTTNLVNFLEAWLRDFRIYEIANERVELNEFKSMIPELVEDALSGNGILTNKVVPDATDVRKVYEKIYNKLEAYHHG